MAGKKRLLLIGWDSADWKIIHPLLDEGKLPGVRELVERGVSGNLTTLEPQLSPMLWTSIATGKMAYHHGVHGFTEVDPVSGRVVPVSAATRRCKTVWEMLGESGLRSHVVGWFATQGETGLDGKMVSNMFPHLAGIAPDQLPADWPPPMPGTYWPADLGAELDALRVSPQEITGDVLRAFVPDGHKVDQQKDRRLHLLASKLAEAYSVQSAATYLMETDPEWDFMAVYFRAIDEISHLFMPCHPPRMEGIPEADFEIYRDVVAGAYQAHDMMLRRLVELAGPDTAVMLVSDHGFHSDHLRPKFTPRVPAGITVWHRAQGVFMANGPGFRQDGLIHGARLLDVTPTILHHFGLPVGEDMEGRVLVEAFDETRPIASIPTWESPGGRDRNHASLSAEQGKSLLDQFVALGYIDEVSTDPSIAAAETDRENKWNLARACLYGGQYEMALRLLEECHAASPERADFSQILAKTQIRLGLLDHAEITLQSCLASLGPTNTAQLLMGGIEAARGNHRKALEHLAVVRTNEPENLQLLFNLSDSLLALRQWQDAEDTAVRMLELDPGSAQAHIVLARCFLHRGDPEKAVDAALDVVGLQFGNPRGHFLLGVALFQLGNWAAAEKALRNNLRLNPLNGVAARYLAQVCRALDRPEDAERVEFESRTLRAKNLAGEKMRVALLREDTARRASAADGARKPSASGSAEDPPIRPMEFVLVSGLPRSGTSLMMQILRAAGMELMHDGNRTPDEDNPEGYWEWDEIRALGKNPRLIERAEGKVTKVISALLPHLPPRHRYKIVFMRRPVEEVVESQWKMLRRRGVEPRADKVRTARDQETHVEQVLARLRTSDRVELLEVDFPALVADPEPVISRVLEFVGVPKTDPAIDPAAIVKPELYRNRAVVSPG